MVVYGRVASVARPVLTVLCGWTAFLLGVALPIKPPPALSLVLVAACFALGLVLALTAVSGALGAHLSGLLAPFPVIATVLAVFTHAHGGAAQVGVLLRNFLFGFYGFAAFCFVLAIALPSLATTAAFALATAAALAVQATIFLLRSRLVAAPSTAS